MNANKLFFGASLFLLGIIIGLLITRSDGGFSSTPVLAQTMRPSTAGGIMAFTGQIDKEIYGIMMVDVDAGTLWVYQYRKAGNQLKLLAARSWLYDRYLEEYNTSQPTPSDVAQLVASQQQKSPLNPTTAPAEEEEKK
ncbi:MAG: hypothetical protein WC975_08940 [Phycisphaerae bacterium]